MKTKQKWNRILKLADFVEKLPRKRFDFGKWAGEEWEGAPDLSCGTSACALGWATTMPYFRKLGLRLERRKFEDGYTFLEVEFNGLDDDWNRAKLFGVSLDTFRSLFIPGHGLAVDASAKRWAKHAREIVAELKTGEII